ncbi:MAG: TatD family hydrolase [Gammaproteobacteria bacterium]
MHLIDSHCHLDRLDLSNHENNLDNAIAAAKALDVTHMLCVCITMENFPAVLQTAQKYDNVWASVGLHPTEREGEDPTVDKLISLAKQEKVIAIGETGLDYYRCEGDMMWQHERFARHIAVAKQIQKPLIIHSRQARKETIAVMREHHAQEARGVMHCFTETWEMAKQAMDLGFYVSLSGIVTFKNAPEIHELAKKIPLDRLFIETDSPYLAPMPHRGKPNEPAYVRYVAECIAELRGESLEKIAEATTKNFCDLFGVRVG